MLCNYILFPYEAQRYHAEYTITPSSQMYIGILGHKLYTAFVNLETRKILQAKSAEPFFFTASNEDDVDSLCEILQGYLYRKTKRSMSFEVIKYDMCTLIYPLFENHYLYGCEGMFLRDLKVFKHRSYVSYSDIALEYQIREREFFDVEVQEDIVTCSKRMEIYVAKDELALRKAKIQAFVDDLYSQGLYSIPSHTLESAILIELAEVWQLKKKITPDHVTVTKTKLINEPGVGTIEGAAQRELLEAIKSNSNKFAEQERNPIDLVGQPLAEWLQDSIERLLIDKSPVCRLMHKNPEGLFAMLCDKFPLLKSFKVSVSGMLCEIPVLGPEHVEYLLSIKDTVLSNTVIEVKETPDIIRPVYWYVKEQSKVFEVIDNDVLTANDVHSRFDSGYYSSVWNTYFNEKFGINSVLRVKFPFAN